MNVQEKRDHLLELYSGVLTEEDYREFAQDVRDAIGHDQLDAIEDDLFAVY
jgi:hypothetical protein